MVHRILAIGASSLALSLTLTSTTHAQRATTDPSAARPARVAMSRATGTFEVKLAPQPKDDYADGATLSRLTIDKVFAGDLVGASKGQMLAARTPVEGSAGYVAIELVTGAIAGRRGTFVFQHSGTMSRGTPALTLTVVPDSGTGELTGLAGSMQIIIANGRHSYELDYTLPTSP
jgi:hypothetical protein